jgi:hypothetical protein
MADDEYVDILDMLGLNSFLLQNSFDLCLLSSLLKDSKFQPLDIRHVQDLSLKLHDRVNLTHLLTIEF